MQIVDVTLRDGGFTCDFDWPIKFAQEYYNLMSKLGVTEEKIQKWSNIGGCGCGARKKFLNQILSFRKKE